MKKKANYNITIISQWFPPEQAPIGYMMLELAYDLSHAGYNVTIITGFPNHPNGIVFKGYQKKWFHEETLNGIKIWRIYLFTSAKRTRFNRILTFLSFTLVSCWTILRRSQSDIFFAVLQPLSIGLILPIIARIKKSRIVFNIQDLHPDVPIELGLIKNPVFIKFLKWTEAYAYRSADKITVICDNFKDHVVKKGVIPDNVKVIKNWIDFDIIRPSDRINDFRNKIACSSDDFIVLYAGTIGLISGAEIVLKVARKFSNESKIKFVFVGEGAMLKLLKEEILIQSLNNVILMPFQDRLMLNQVQATADLSLLTLLKNKGNYSFPSKILAYMAAGRPIVASVDKDSIAAKQIKEANCGLVVPPEDAEALKKAIIYLKDSKRLRLDLGKNGREYIEKNLKREKLTGEYISLFSALVC